MDYLRIEEKGPFFIEVVLVKLEEILLVRTALIRELFHSKRL